MKTWREIFGETPAWLIILGFSAGSILLGFVLAIFLAYYGVITSVAPLMATALGSAVGAAIASSATLYAATYNQRRSERRELRPAVRALEREINTVYGQARAAHASMRQCQRRHMTGEPYDRKMITDRIEIALGSAIKIKPDDKLPLEVVHRVDKAIDRMCGHLYDAQTCVDEARNIDRSQGNYMWEKAEAAANLAADRMSEIHQWLRSWAT